MNEGHFDDVDVSKIVDCEAAMQAYLKSNNGDLLDAINADPKYSDEVVAKMKVAVEEFKKNGSW